MKNRHRFHKKRKPAKKDNIIFWRSDYYTNIKKIKEELNKKGTQK
jgi:hypothetical protein